MLAFVGIEHTQLLCVVEEKICFTNSAATLDGDESVMPIDFVHKHTACGNMHMFDHIIVCLVKSV